MVFDLHTTQGSSLRHRKIHITLFEKIGCRAPKNIRDVFLLVPGLLIERATRISRAGFRWHLTAVLCHCALKYGVLWRGSNSDKFGIESQLDRQIIVGSRKKNERLAALAIIIITSSLKNILSNFIDIYINFLVG